MVVKAVLFDLWNTLTFNDGVKVNPIVKLEEMLGLNIKLYREVEQGFMKKRFKTKKDAMISLCKHIGVKPTDRLVDSLVYMWDHTQLNVAFFPDVVPVLEKLKKTYKLGLISNTDCFTIQEFKQRGFSDYFDSIAFSCELGLLKPDPKIFKLVLHELKVKPEEAIMVGDNYLDDIRAAEKLGIRGILLKRDFSKHKAKPSYIESHEHTRNIKTLTELENMLKQL